MKYTSYIIIIVLVSASVFTWLVSNWQYDTMMSSMMTFYYSPAALSLFTIIWTAGMAGVMFPEIIPMVLFYNRLIDSSNRNTKGGIHSHDTSPMLYHGRDKTYDDKNSNIKSGISMPNSLNQDQNRQRMIHNLINLFRPKTYYMMIFILSYLAIWAITGIVLLIGWSYAVDIILPQLGINDIHSPPLQQQQKEQLSIYIIYGIYQFSSLKARCLGYCES